MSHVHVQNYCISNLRDSHWSSPCVVFDFRRSFCLHPDVVKSFLRAGSFVSARCFVVSFGFPYRGAAWDEEGKDARRRSGDEAFKQHELLTPSLCSLLLESLPKVTGVFFDRSQERWVSSVYMGGRNMKSYFPVYKHGFLQARNMAISQRLSQVAHKGISQTEVNALTPPGLTVETLLDALKTRGTDDGALSFHCGENAELQQEARSQHSKADIAMNSLKAELLQCTSGHRNTSRSCLAS